MGANPNFVDPALGLLRQIHAANSDILGVTRDLLAVARALPEEEQRVVMECIRRLYGVNERIDTVVGSFLPRVA
jgi:hypothetical protein